MWRWDKCRINTDKQKSASFEADFSVSKKSEFQTVGDGVLDVPAVTVALFRYVRQIRNISGRVVQEADPYT